MECPVNPLFCLTVVLVAHGPGAQSYDLLHAADAWASGSQPQASSGLATRKRNCDKEKPNFRMVDRPV